MAQVIDSPSAPIKSPLASSEIHAETGATVPSSRSAREDEQDLERCVLDMDPSRASMVSHIGDCNLECSYCAIRWSARRILTEREE
jgi:sulfatase maturation enzyme AslB (radical SAM superfamily)